MPDYISKGLSRTSFGGVRFVSKGLSRTFFDVVRFVSLRSLFFRAWLSFIILSAFLANSFGPVCPIVFCADGEFFLPAPGAMVHLSPEFNPPILKGIKVHPDNPFQFDFILDQGDTFPNLVGSDVKAEATRLIKYFLASLTIPDNDLWVNLSPYEKNRIIPQSFGLTEMGRDLLAEDYVLKQITASLIYPEDVIGKKFWKRIYEEAAKHYGTTDIPVNTYNKVWIVPQKAVVYENAKAGTAYVVESKLKVMLEQDYLALQKQLPLTPSLTKEGGNSVPHLFYKEGVRGSSNDINTLGSQIIRQIVIPALTKEVNEGKNFAQLRQVYNSLILAAWYKKKIKDSILSQVYADKNKIAGVQYASINNERDDVEFIYQRYLQAFKKGVYNYIKEEPDPMTNQVQPRKYFSGGIKCCNFAQLVLRTTTFFNQAGLARPNGLFDLKANFAMSSPREQPRAEMNVDGPQKDKYTIAAIIHGDIQSVEQIMVDHGLWKNIFKKDEIYAQSKVNRFPRVLVQVAFDTEQDRDIAYEEFKKIEYAEVLESQDVTVAASPEPETYSKDFGVTSNNEIWIRVNGVYQRLKNKEMDCSIRINPDGSPQAVRYGHAKKGDIFVTGHQGIVDIPLDVRMVAGKKDFKFMGAPVSAERPSKPIIEEVLNNIWSARFDMRGPRKVMAIAGTETSNPASREGMKWLIENGFINVLVLGGEMAKRDLEADIFGTFHGHDIQNWENIIDPRDDLGNEAVNRVRQAGSLEQALKEGLIKDGILASALRNKVKLVIVSSIDDDIALPEAITNSGEAQDEIRKSLDGVEVQLMLASTLLSIATGNISPVDIYQVLVDQNSAVASKAGDRGSSFKSLIKDVAGFVHGLKEMAYKRMQDDGRPIKNLPIVEDNKVPQMPSFVPQNADVVLQAAPQDRVFPIFYAKKRKLKTLVMFNGQWLVVQGEEDKAGIRIVITDNGPRAEAVGFDQVREGDLIVTGLQGVKEESLESPQNHDSLMPVNLAARKAADAVFKAKVKGEDVLLVLGPTVNHSSGARKDVQWLLEHGAATIITGGNALEVHDVESDLSHTSLGMDVETAKAVVHGHEKHLRAINELRQHKGAVPMVERGRLKGGMIWAAIKNKIKWFIFGSIRDDGPSPDTVTDVLRARDMMRKNFDHVKVAIMVGSRLHALSAYQFLPADALVVNADIYRPNIISAPSDAPPVIRVETDAETFLKCFRQEYERLTRLSATAFNSIVMVDPTHYKVIYAINENMSLHNLPDVELAKAQWHSYRSQIMGESVPVHVLEGGKEVPDMVFAANAGLVVKGKGGKMYFIISRFATEQRQLEEVLFIEHFRRMGYTVVSIVKGFNWEGEGDFLLVNGHLVGGYNRYNGKFSQKDWERSDPEAHIQVAQALGLEDRLVLLELIHPLGKLYHLDTAFFPLDDETIIYHAGSFSVESQERIKTMTKNVISLSDDDAANFAANGLRVKGKKVFLHENISDGLIKQLEHLGYTVIKVPMSELLKAGGSAKCLILKNPAIDSDDIVLDRYAIDRAMSSPKVPVADPVEDLTQQELGRIENELNRINAEQKRSVKDTLRDSLIRFSLNPGVKNLVAYILKKLGGNPDFTNWADRKRLLDFVRWMSSKFILPIDTTTKDQVKLARETRRLIDFIEQKYKEHEQVTIDNVGDASANEQDAKQYLDYYDTLIDALAKVPAAEIPEINLSIKFSGLVYEYDKIALYKGKETQNEESLHKAQEIKRKLKDLIIKTSKVKDRPVFVRIDAEEYAYRDATIQVFKEVVEELKASNPKAILAEDGKTLKLGVVVQAYLKDSYANLIDLKQWGEKNNIIVPVRLVKGAYVNLEKPWAKIGGYDSPVFREKESTDANYEELSDYLLRNINRFKPAFGTQNIRSMAHVLALAEYLKIDRTKVEIQMLYGMGESVQKTMVKLGHQIRIYLPAGTLARGLGYAGRRFLEISDKRSALVQTMLGIYNLVGKKPSYQKNDGPILELLPKSDTYIEKMVGSIKREHAMISEQSMKTIVMNNGGIDLRPANMHLQTQNNNDEIAFHINPAMLARLQSAPGFTVGSITIQPLKSLSGFLGLDQ